MLHVLHWRNTWKAGSITSGTASLNSSSKGCTSGGNSLLHFLQKQQERMRFGKDLRFRRTQDNLHTIISKRVTLCLGAWITDLEFGLDWGGFENFSIQFILRLIQIQYHSKSNSSPNNGKGHW
ncbi:uncharacterized protein LOC131148586 [Malania oleifera]|uniref:uncharacterized protein LOC131148586 n=1 Tax=Malania oleifera TaxID=397392 RepID=UPI0025ADCCAC|nr:uncharacterized protein LOC131148586 [Malania oleifera]